jgi:hypothetical protein
VSTSYFTNFLTCTVLGDTAGCRGAETPQRHLSQAYASEYSPDGGDGPNKCLTIPTKPTLEQALDPNDPAHLVQGLLGIPPYSCSR